MIYFNFRKAFDTVPHARLLLKLQEYGISGNLLRWLDGFLSNRRQRVLINNSFSQLSPVSSGVPQGSACPWPSVVHYLAMSMIYHPVLVAPY